MKRSFFLFVFLFFAISSIHPLSRAPSLDKAHIGVQTLNYKDVTRNRPVVVEFWYPTTQKEIAVEPKESVWIHPKEVRNAPLNEGKYPLIIMSHGNYGDRRDRSWLADYLVQKGFWVISVEHHGDSWRSFEPLTNFRFWERSKDISFVLTQVLQDDLLKDRIDPKRIGFLGYSLGGMTGLILAGAKPEHVKEIMLEQNAKYKWVDTKVVEELDVSEAYECFFEPRIKAMALLSPAVFGLTEESLQKIKIPTMMVTSKGDEVLRFQDHALKVIKNISAKVKLLKDAASHYVYFNRVSKKGKAVLRKELQRDGEQVDRQQVHNEIGPFIADFLKENL
jgi:predicted dienelactone hydrolase